jgi:hypothetical protein
MTSKSTKRTKVTGNGRQDSTKRKFGKMAGFAKVWQRRKGRSGEENIYFTRNVLLFGYSPSKILDAPLAALAR